MKLTVLKSIIGSSIMKLGAAALSFFTVPLLLDTLNKNDYAIWVTVTGLIAWLNLFDFGSGYSLKNKITENIAENKEKELTPLIAGTIQFYLLIAILILLIYFVLLFCLPVFEHNKALSIILYLPIIITFPNLVGHFIIQGLKKFNLFNGLLFVQSFFWFIVVFSAHQNWILLDLSEFATFYSLLFVVINGFIFFLSIKKISFDFKELLNFNHFSKSKNNLKVGLRFFILQLSSLILFSLGNLLTYNNLSSEEVVRYDTINKIYIMGITLFNIVISVYWAELSHAKAIKDKKLLIKKYKQLLLLAVIYSIGAIVLTSFIPILINAWTKGIVDVDPNQLFPFLLLTCAQVFAYSGAAVLNAFEELKMQIWLATFSSIGLLPLANLLFNMQFGIGSVPLASSIFIIPTAIFLNISARKLLVRQI